MASYFFLKERNKKKAKSHLIKLDHSPLKVIQGNCDYFNAHLLMFHLKIFTQTDILINITNTNTN